MSTLHCTLERASDLKKMKWDVGLMIDRDVAEKKINKVECQVTKL